MANQGVDLDRQSSDHHRRQPRHRPRHRDCGRRARLSRRRRLCQQQGGGRRGRRHDRGQERQGDRREMRRRSTRATSSRCSRPRTASARSARWSTMPASSARAACVSRRCRPQRIQRMMAVNVTGSILCAREAVKRMSTKSRRQGRRHRQHFVGRRASSARPTPMSIMPPRRARSIPSPSASATRSPPTAFASPRSAPA